jgi:hypothetical protein
MMKMVPCTNAAPEVVLAATASIFLFGFFLGTLYNKKNKNTVENKKIEEQPEAFGIGYLGGKYILDFGKYRGVCLKYVPDSYLNWLIDHGVMASKPELLACYRTMIKKGY